MISSPFVGGFFLEVRSLQQKNIAEVIIDNSSRNVDKLFHYRIPDDKLDKVQVGVKVLVPFGKGNNKRDAFIVNIVYESEYAQLKEIHDIVDESPLYDEKMVALIKWMRERYVCTYYEALKTILPTGIGAKQAKDKNVRMVYLVISDEEALDYIEQMRVKAPVQIRVIEMLLENKFMSSADLVSLSKGTYGTLKTLHKKGLIAFKKQIIKREIINIKTYKQVMPHDATLEQKNVMKLVMENIYADNATTIMIRGVTGSGKTEVFLQVIDKLIALGKQAIVLVPEIALTPQMVERFVSRFQSRVAVFHSRLSIGERYEQWKMIKNSEVDIVIGARSAIFAPFNNLGLIIIDEEHEYSYKSELSPRYHTREVAEQRSKIENAVVLLSSATPSVESYYKAEQGKYQLAHMVNRYNNASLPEVSVVDMRDQLINGNKSIFSSRLREEIEQNIRLKQQTILFLNRRGFSTFVSCRSCGLVLKCPRCNISLTYHMHDNALTCHYCGFKRENVKKCPKCDSKYIRYFGIGTQKVENEIKRVFPDASVLRMDVDTTSKKFSHEKILNTFKNDNIDILIGTQMVSKGLDFPNVTLIGVLAADMSLNIDDFRSAERTFQLLTQVSGRAGRGEVAGRAIVQTYDPDNYTIQLAKQHDYLTFYNDEIQIRKQLNYPPFCDIISIFVNGVYESAVIRRISEITSSFKGKIFDRDIQQYCQSILGPTPAPISKIKNKYRWRVILKCENNHTIREILREILYDHYTDRHHTGLNLMISINPINMY